MRRMWRCKLTELNCVSTYIRLMPLLMQFDSGISINRYLPASGTAASSDIGQGIKPRPASAAKKPRPGCFFIDIAVAPSEVPRTCGKRFARPTDYGLITKLTNLPGTLTTLTSVLPASNSAIRESALATAC